MKKETITYKDYDGNERTEDFYFNLTRAEIADLELQTPGGIANLVREIANTKNVPELSKLFRRLILLSYGKKSADGRRFMKSDEITADFTETEAFPELYIRLITNVDEAVKFVNDIMPAELVEQKANEEKAQEGNIVSIQ